jgi:type I restriction enzyme R subunit
LQLVQQYHDTNCQDKTIIVKLRKQIEASPDMRDKRELIEKFIDQMTPEKGADVGEQWEAYIEREKKAELDAIITEENLRKEAAYEFMSRAFSEGYVTETGTAMTEVLPPMGLFGKGNKRAIKKATVLKKLKEYFDRFYELGGS